jgi:hypothetical protein
MINTRYWRKPAGESSTAVQWRDDTRPQVWVFTNVGWVPIIGTPADPTEAQVTAEKLATEYGLVEVKKNEALFMAGVESVAVGHA